MQRGKRNIYKVYKKTNNSICISNIVHFIYNKILPWCKRSTWPYQYKGVKEDFIEQPRERSKRLKDVTMAIICDDMTYSGFEQECKCVFLTPSNWMEQLRKHPPDLLFCESAWHGVKSYADCWRGRIYKNNKLIFENRKDLLNIIDFCKKNHIPTVFWNKEDPTYFSNREYDFVSTALLFDYLYTTSDECKQHYKALGHKNVGELMFGVSPKLFNPLGYNGKDKQAVFAGSWYADQIERCEDMKNLFNQVFNEGIDLEIYDRHSDSNNPNHCFPDAYKEYIHEKVDFEELEGIFKTAQFGININTVKDSDTMFARRVFEMMASNLIVISNDSKGLKKLFGEKIWFINSSFDLTKTEQYKAENLRNVFLNHTCRKRLEQVFLDIGGIIGNYNEPLYVLYDDYKGAQEHFEQIQYSNKVGLVKRENSYFNLLTEEIIAQNQLHSKGYVIWIEEINKIPDVEFMKVHFDYIDSNYGISRDGEPYTVQENNNNRDVLIKVCMLEELIQNKNIIKYFI